MDPQLFAPVIAGLALTVSLWVKFGDQRLARKRDWQRDVVYTVIEQSFLRSEHPTLAEIRTQYLQKAQQLQPLSFRLRRSELQEVALHRILLDLQRDGLVEQGEGGRYRLPARSALDAFTAGQLNGLLKERRIRPRVLEILEDKSGRITRDGLVRELRRSGVDVDFDEVDNLLFALIGPAVIASSDGSIKFSWHEQNPPPRNDFDPQ